MTRRALGGEGQRGRRNDRGSVVAEFAVALPAVALVLLLCAGALTAAARQVRLQDATADAARLVARGESDGRAFGVLSAAVHGATGAVEHRGDLVCVSATAPAGVPSLTIGASSCALAGGL